MTKPFIHQDNEWKNLIQIVSESKNIIPTLIEKDYWIMHVLWSLTDSDLSYFMKGGTSLSKAYHVIDRFSEDIDLLIEDESMKSKTSRKDKSVANVKKREKFFNGLVEQIKVPGSAIIYRNNEFDSDYLINAGITVSYPSLQTSQGVKPGILLEIGFDNVEPWEEKTVSSWIIDFLEKTGQLEKYFDNRALKVRCYRPEYTFVEKLQAISTKYRKLMAGEDPSNFARHYYDIHKLLKLEEIQKFIGTEEYQKHKKERFRPEDEKNLTKSEAFILSDSTRRKQIEERYENTKALYYGEAPTLENIIDDLKSFLPSL
ncbi:nucleotidyl transferase, PF08843 family [Leptospira broomii serovar Hurstbridge str. 5399]|uniref:Nucleotidyl transferase, PF08843 family n=1 Tax=Leptospira broomii serovar Hurstbridge str. 5399 TaxID=1049789 RepID=T0GEM5_9LEPT|nr:nucleotidyl transferase AbiEii/AbiGii toxin family protein [Leptospira broomii]EQA43858.1 nucleotidyl transferase, PF08843 family [Leptospira broomii serovar Hurstbridge str. 5399]TGM09678.1 nucleotidyl transferase AbiEii/AbiGii toxin family protein [Leptospira yasudae]